MPELPCPARSSAPGRRPSCASRRPGTGLERIVAMKSGRGMRVPRQCTSPVPDPAVMSGDAGRRGRSGRTRPGRERCKHPFDVDLVAAAAVLIPPVWVALFGAAAHRRAATGPRRPEGRDEPRQPPARAPGARGAHRAGGAGVAEPLRPGALRHHWPRTGGRPLRFASAPQAGVRRPLHRRREPVAGRQGHAVWGLRQGIS